MTSFDRKQLFLSGDIGFYVGTAEIILLQDGQIVLNAKKETTLTKEQWEEIVLTRKILLTAQQPSILSKFLPNKRGNPDD